jgi:sec-independent protein translocase protein TatA
MSLKPVFPELLLSSSFPDAPVERLSPVFQLTVHRAGGLSCVPQFRVCCRIQQLQRRFIMPGVPGPVQMIIFLVIILLLFGKRLPGAMRSLGSSVTEFKKGTREAEEGEPEERDKDERDKE